MPESAKKSVKNVAFHSNGATIRTGRETQCLPYAGFFFLIISVCCKNRYKRAFDIFSLSISTYKFRLAHTTLFKIPLAGCQDIINRQRDGNLQEINAMKLRYFCYLEYL